MTTTQSHEGGERSTYDEWKCRLDSAAESVASSWCEIIRLRFEGGRRTELIAQSIFDRAREAQAAIMRDGGGSDLDAQMEVDEAQLCGVLRFIDTLPMQRPDLVGLPSFLRVNARRE